MERDKPPDGLAPTENATTGKPERLARIRRAIEVYWRRNGRLVAWYGQGRDQ